MSNREAAAVNPATNGNGANLGRIPTHLAEYDIDMTGQAINFYNRAMHELEEHVIKGDVAAKTALLTGWVIGKNVILVGEPAGGKSTLANNFHYLFEGIGPEDIALIPGEHDITAKEIVGGIVSQTIREDGEEYEKISVIEGLVKPTTKALRLEEPNRMPQHALQSLLPAMENRWLETTAGRVYLPGLRVTAATMNQTESRQSTFRLSNAMASRFNIGAITGVTGDAEARSAMFDATDGFEPTPEDMTKIADMEFLDELRDYVLDTAEPADIRERRKELTFRTADAMREEGIKEADRRFQIHIDEVARALGGLRNAEHAVKEGDLNDAVRLVVAARLGALSAYSAAEAGAIMNSVIDS